MRTFLMGTFVGRTADKMDMHFKPDNGLETRVDPFVGCVVVPNDYDPFTDDAKDYIQPHDYQIHEDELMTGRWEVVGQRYPGPHSTLLVSSMRKLEEPST